MSRMPMMIIMKREVSRKQVLGDQMCFRTQEINYYSMREGLLFFASFSLSKVKRKEEAKSTFKSRDLLT